MAHVFVGIRPHLQSPASPAKDSQVESVVKDPREPLPIVVDKIDLEGPMVSSFLGSHMLRS